MQYLNIHTHHASDSDTQAAIRNLDFSEAGVMHEGFASAGLHPWFLKNIDWDAAEAWLRARAANPQTLAVGESGLDKICDTPWTDQLRAFDLCITIAAELQKPMVLHCVKAFSETTAILKNTGLRAVFHGFDKHPNTAQELLRAGFYLSFGAALLRTNSHAAEALRRCPADRFFLETDEGMTDIREVYARAAEIRECTLEALDDRIRQNAAAFFGLF